MSQSLHFHAGVLVFMVFASAPMATPWFAEAAFKATGDARMALLTGVRQRVAAARDLTAVFALARRIMRERE